MTGRAREVSQISVPWRYRLFPRIDDDHSYLYSAMAQAPTKASIQIKVLFFASAREAAGNVSQMELSFEESITTARLRTILAERYPGLAKMVLDEDSLTLALNEEYVPSGEVIELKDGDTVALIPPISGG